MFQGHGLEAFRKGHGLDYFSTGSTLAAPVNTVLPAVTPAPTAESGTTLTCARGTWTGYPAITYTYQWKRDGTNISGATSSTYTTIVADEGTDVTCLVTGTNSEGSDTGLSNAVSISAPTTVTADSGTVKADTTAIRADGSFV